ncbi:MAG: sugar ABC transporter permease [Clostridia bacterium]|nr:sugar ABC transporter permease [Clostridia bacterium]
MKSAAVQAPNIPSAAAGLGSNSTVKIRKKNFFEKMKGNWDLLMFCLPGIVVTLIYHYWPIYGVQIGFKNYKVGKGILGSSWTGLENFERFFRSAYAWLTIKNTLILSFYSMAAGFPMAVILALLLNSFRHKRYRKVIQAVTYAPHFISTIVMCGMVILFLSPRVGVINTVIRSFGGEAVNFMGKSEIWRHIYVWSGVWQGMGWSSVIYFAALSGVSPEYHEAAIVDGATKFQRMIHIDLPFLAPTMTMLLILDCGSILSVGFEKAYALQNDLNQQVSEIISTYTYKVGIINNDQSFSTAIGLFNSAVNSILLISVNAITRSLSENSLW